MRLFFFLALPFFSLISCTAKDSAIKVNETDQGFLFSENGENILFYQREPKSFDGKYTRNNYVHPLWSLDGDTLTEDYPPDHAHHRGIFWTWHQIYVGDTRLGDAWECNNFVWDVTDAQVEDTKNGAKTLAVTVLWKSPDFVDQNGKMLPAVQENTRITVYPKAGIHRAIDFEISLLALEENVQIGGSDDIKGYGGFSPRIKCPKDLTFLSSAGQVEPKNEAIQAGPWMDMLAGFDGEQQSGFAVLNHPSNPAPIDMWILRKARSMQNPVYPGRELESISQHEPTLLKYRVIVHRGDADIGHLYSEYE